MSHSDHLLDGGVNEARLRGAAYPELAWHPRSLAGVRYPHESLENTYEPGVSEPWIQQLVSALLVASGARHVLETGGFLGITSEWLARTLESMGGGVLNVCDIDPTRAALIERRLTALDLKETLPVVYGMDVLDLIQQFPDESLEFAWIDDCHEKPHVAVEIERLSPKMARKGLLVFHDVCGSVDLQEVVKAYGGYSLDLPRMGPAGGIGIIQKP